VVVGHGQMSEDQLEDVMLKFVRYEADVLVSTTIIENGLDIPLVNTIIINRADRYGLAQLYQLRGRVGRSNRRAYAYLLVPSEDTLSDVARRRLAAIREFSDLGAGFRIAALDLEIRGAGNLLGGEQHGHIDAVGFDLYCQLLEQTVQEIKGEQPVQESPTAINLNMDIRIPEEYVGETSQRLRLYKKIASIKDEEQLAALREEIRDRHGPFPEQLENLFAYADLRIQSTRLGIETIDRKGGRILAKFSDRSPIDPARLLALIRKQPGVSFSPGGVLSVEESSSSGQKTLDQVRMLLQKIG
jgi:transcription-repair coupling factor (superfamily II helicase)